MSDKCPKCGAEVTKNQVSMIRYSCESEFFLVGVLCQSDKCRIRELEAENARLRARVEELKTAGDMLYNEQNGPPLLREEKAWRNAMAAWEAASEKEIEK